MLAKITIRLGWFILLSLITGCSVGVNATAEVFPSLAPELVASPFPTITPVSNTLNEGIANEQASSTGIQVPPAGDDPRLLMLYSHARWTSLWADVLVTNYLGDDAQTVTDQTRTQVWLQQPASGRLLSGPAGGAPTRLWVSDGLAMQENRGDIMPVSPVTIGDFLPAYSLDSVTPHPYGGMMGTMVADFILSTGLGQRSGEYRLVGREPYAGRDTLVVEYYRYPNDPVLERLWVDAETGVILHYASFGKPGGGPLSVELQVQAIQYNQPFDPAIFAFNQALPNEFAPGQ